MFKKLYKSHREGSSSSVCKFGRSRTVQSKYKRGFQSIFDHRLSPTERFSQNQSSFKVLLFSNFFRFHCMFKFYLNFGALIVIFIFLIIEDFTGWVETSWSWRSLDFWVCSSATSLLTTSFLHQRSFQRQRITMRQPQDSKMLNKAAESTADKPQIRVVLAKNASSKSRTSNEKWPVDFMDPATSISNGRWTADFNLPMQ